jgi:hypothetical protein
MPSKSDISLDKKSPVYTRKKVARVKEAKTTNWEKISIGCVEVTVRKPTPVELKKRIAESNAALARLRSVIGRLPGIKLKFKSTTPVYWADERDTSLVVRKLGTKTTRGRFDKNGVFVKVK